MHDRPSATGLPSMVKGIPLSEEPGLGALTLPGFLSEVTTRFADREALVLRTPAGVVRWNYSTLWERAAEIARSSIACGIGKDGRVGILMPNRPEWIASFFGAGLAGGVPVALSTFSTAPELKYLLQASCVSILLFERQDQGRSSTRTRRETAQRREATPIAATALPPWPWPSWYRADWSS